MTYIGWLITYAVFVFIYFFIGYHCLPLDVYHSIWFALLGFAYPIILLVVLGVILAVLEQKGFIKLPPPKEPTQADASTPATEVHAETAPSIASEAPSPPPAPSQPTVDDLLSQIDLMDGRRFERLCSRMLRRIGFSDIQLTKASGDQGVDITAVKDDIRYAFQCKCYSSDLGNHPIQEVHAGKSMYNCHVGVVMTNRYFTPGAKGLAKATGTLLWDRDKLKSILQDILDQEE